VPLIDKYKTLLFDLDGTLTDPKIGITKSVHYALNKMGIKDVATESLVKFIGPPLGESFTNYYDFDKEQADFAIRYYREYFSETGIFENTLYPGISILLQKLKEKTIKLIVATSKPTVYARTICEHFSILQYFTEIEGSELDGRLSNKSELIGYIVKKHCIDKDKVLMIGDREHDVIGAKNNTIKSIGVGYGYGSREELEGSGATYYVNTIEELSTLLIGKST